MDIAVGDKIIIRQGINAEDFKPNQIGVVAQLGVKYAGDVRVKFPHDPELLWVYHDEYDKHTEPNEKEQIVESD